MTRRIVEAKTIEIEAVLAVVPEVAAAAVAAVAVADREMSPNGTQMASNRDSLTPMVSSSKESILTIRIGTVTSITRCRRSNSSSSLRCNKLPCTMLMRT